MSVLNNRHVRIALVLAPLLGVGAFVAVDRRLTPRPQAAAEGASYPLAAKSNCRYSSGACNLENGDVKLLVRGRRAGETTFEISVESALPIGSAVLSVGEAESFSEPATFGAGDSFRLDAAEPEQLRMRWAFQVGRATYYAETSGVFLQRELSFPVGNFAQQREQGLSSGD